jgi:hypothetical protein
MIVTDSCRRQRVLPAAQIEVLYEYSRGVREGTTDSNVGRGI